MTIRAPSGRYFVRGATTTIANEPGCPLSLAGTLTPPCLPKKLAAIHCGHPGCQLYAGDEARAPNETRQGEPGSELNHRVENYLAEKLEPILRKSPPANVVWTVVATLESRGATFEHFQSCFESESERMRDKGTPIRSYGFAPTIALECSTLDPVPPSEGQYQSDKEKRYAQKKLLEALDDGDQ